MSKLAGAVAPPDQSERTRALDPARSFLVQAPAGSGKTDLLTRRFLRLLAKVDDPAEIVAITFTKAAAAEMRDRILVELERAATTPDSADDADEFSMQSLARRALAHAVARGWNILDQSSQLRISTIDSFCRELAIQQPLLSGFGSELQIAEQPAELYRRAARRTLEQLAAGDLDLSAAVESLLLWRDNAWHELEGLLVKMLAQRDRWMHDFLLARQPDWERLRSQLERPFARAIEQALTRLHQLISQAPHALEEVHALVRFACDQSGGVLHRELAELAEFPTAPYEDVDALDEARRAWLCVANLLLTGARSFRKSVNKNDGFPQGSDAQKKRHRALVEDLRAVEGFEAALAALCQLPSARYDDQEWVIVRALFAVLRHAAGELRVAFAEADVVDFVEVAQVARLILDGEEGQPGEAALAFADQIRHLLVDEFQDTSRRQIGLLASIAGRWADPEGRTLFVVGDPMQSIYSFRDADAELFFRVREAGLEITGGESIAFQSVRLSSNFRTEPSLVADLNRCFGAVFAEPDGSGIEFAEAMPFRSSSGSSEKGFTLHCDFIPQSTLAKSDPAIASQRDAVRAGQLQELVSVIRLELDRAAEAGSRGESRYRIAVLGRARKSIVPIAAELRKAGIPFSAIELEVLRERPEVLDALALARALFNPLDRVAWLGVLRAPWCGLPLADLHRLTSNDESELLARPIPDLLEERQSLISPAMRPAVERVLSAARTAASLHEDRPTAALGSWLEQVWLSLGGTSCVDAEGRANLDLLWACLDALPEGELDLLGPNLSTALERLTALPDPAANPGFGVQLMTIHKSKGLEFEVVLVPDLQAGSRKTEVDLLCWLERGLADPDASGDLTEFLVAPISAKGADAGSTRRWVENVRRARASQEMRRILYVAATRARQQLHLFALPAYKMEAGEPVLCEPRDTLLATAWPALENEIRSRFEAWKASRATPQEHAQISSLAASADVLPFPAPAWPTLLRRLPLDFAPPSMRIQSGSLGTDVDLRNARLYTRHEGGIESRALGSAVHALLEELARLRADSGWPAARSGLASMQARLRADLRSLGITRAGAETLTAQAIELALQASNDPHGQWILSPHLSAESEVAWSGVLAGAVRTLRADRVFRAGLHPLDEGDAAWWIVDYKTAEVAGGDPATALSSLRGLFAPQLEAYAAILRKLHGSSIAIRAALYYPRALLFDWWEIPA